MIAPEITYAEAHTAKIRQEQKLADLLVHLNLYSPFYHKQVRPAIAQ
jgi:hypothetical protein